MPLLLTESRSPTYRIWRAGGGRRRGFDTFGQQVVATEGLTGACSADLLKTLRAGQLNGDETVQLGTGHCLAAKRNAQASASAIDVGSVTLDREQPLYGGCGAQRSGKVLRLLRAASFSVAFRFESGFGPTRKLTLE
jgi:hypothetical protein